MCFHGFFIKTILLLPALWWIVWNSCSVFSKEFSDFQKMVIFYMKITCPPTHFSKHGKPIWHRVWHLNPSKDHRWSYSNLTKLKKKSHLHNHVYQTHPVLGLSEHFSRNYVSFGIEIQSIWLNWLCPPTTFLLPPHHIFFVGGQCFHVRNHHFLKMWKFLTENTTGISHNPSKGGQ